MKIDATPQELAFIKEVEDCLQIARNYGVKAKREGVILLLRMGIDVRSIIKSLANYNAAQYISKMELLPFGAKPPSGFKGRVEKMVKTGWLKHESTVNPTAIPKDFKGWQIGEKRQKITVKKNGTF